MNAKAPEHQAHHWLLRWFMFAAYVALATVTSVPAFSKHTARPIAFTVSYLAVLVIGGSWLLTIQVTPDRYRTRHAVAWLTLCVALALGNAMLYPRTRLSAAHSSAPEALIDPAERLISGVHPYAGVLPEGVPISPGPGWIAAHAPLTTLGLIWLLVPVHLGLAACMMSRAGGASGVIFVVFLLALPAFLQMSLVGHDLFAVGCAMVTVTLALHRQVARQGRAWVLWSIAAGIVATARIPLAVFVGTLALLAFSKNPRFAGKFLAVAGAVTVVTHLTFYLWGRSLGLPYQPLHVFERAAVAGSAAALIGLSLSCGLAVWLWWRGIETAADWLYLVWATTGVPFVAVGFGELVNVNQMNWSSWEGKVYAAFGLPLLIAGMLLTQAPTRKGRPAKVAPFRV